MLSSPMQRYASWYRDVVAVAHLAGVGIGHHRLIVREGPDSGRAGAAAADVEVLAPAGRRAVQRRDDVALAAVDDLRPRVVEVVGPGDDHENVPVRPVEAGGWERPRVARPLRFPLRAVSSRADAVTARSSA